MRLSSDTITARKSILKELDLNPIANVEGDIKMNDSTIKGIMNEAFGLESYKDRFRLEYFMLEERIRKLTSMVKGYRAGTLNFTPDCPLEILELQLSHMGGYRDVLKNRAANYEDIDLSK